MLHSLKRFGQLIVLSTGVLTTSVSAQETSVSAQEEPNGYPIADVNLRAGPGTEYPVLVTVPTEAPITILGCLQDYTWCDTVFEEQRGWMRSIYLAGYYDGEYYLLSDYAPDLGYQTVTFDVAAYWDAYYRDEPFYNAQHRATAPRGEGWVDDGVFYDRLSPYGSWTWTQGQYVWVPTGVDASWRPYTRGRWVYTDYGWTWVSNEPFGWATYHYGRWGFSDRIGWFWVPGNQWGPAWVSWRQSDDDLAWAPLPPVYDRGVSVNVSIGTIPGYYWSIVPSRYFLSDDLPRYYVRDRDRDRWRRAYDRTQPVGHTTVINNTVVNKVVNVNYVERQTNRKVVERKVRHTRDWDRAGKIHGDAFEVYRPGLQEGRGRNAPNNPREIDEVAKLSRTKAEARGEATTEDMLAPPEVREAIKKRKGSRAGGEPSGANDLSRGETGAAKFDRRLPKGQEAEGPPPVRKKAKAKAVPATDLGPSRVGHKGPASGSRPENQDVKQGPKGPSPERQVGPEAKPSSQGPSGQGPSHRKPHADLKGPPKEKAKPKDENGPKAKAHQQSPAEQQGPSDRKEGAKKKGPPKEKGTSKDENGPPQAKSHQQSPAEQQGPSDRKPGAKKKGPPKEKAKPKDENGPPQAKSHQQSPAEQQGPSDRKPGAKKKGPPKEKGKSKDESGPPQARSLQQGSDGKPAATKAQHKKKAKPKEQSGPQGPPGQSAPSDRKPAAKATPNQRAKTTRTPAQAKNEKQSASRKKTSGSKPSAKTSAIKKQAKPSLRGKPSAKKAAPKRKTTTTKQESPAEAKQKSGATKQASSGGGKAKSKKKKGKEEKGRK